MPWQAYVLDRALRHDKAGDLIHRDALFSTGRQNGKSVIVRSFYGWLLDVGRDIGPFRAWRDIRAAAHDGKQARIIYKAVFQDLNLIPRLTKGPPRPVGAKQIQPPVRLSRHLGIETDTIIFDILTSEPGSARGLSIGALAFDEVLTQRDNDMMEAVEPTQSAQRNAIKLLTSSAGHVDSVVLRGYFDRMVRQASGDEKPDTTFFGVWWQSDHVDVGYDRHGNRRSLTKADWTQIARANPGMEYGRPLRVAIESEHRKWPREGWQRERLNHFVDVKADSVLPPGAWAANRVKKPLDGVSGPFSMGVDIQPGWERATVTVSGMREDGRVGTEVYKDLRREDLDSLNAQTIIDAVMGFPDIDQVLAICYEQVSGGAPAFLRHQEETGYPWDPLKPGAMVAACMDITERILAGTMAVDDPLLDAQMAHLAKRPFGQDGAFRFSRQDSTGAIDGVMAMTLSAHSIAYLGGGPLIG